MHRFFDPQNPLLSKLNLYEFFKCLWLFPITQKAKSKLRETSKALLNLSTIENRKSLKASNTRCTPCLCAQPGAILHHPVIPLHSPIKYMSFQSSPPKGLLRVSQQSPSFLILLPTRYYLHLQGTQPSLLQLFFLYLRGRDHTTISCSHPKFHSIYQFREVKFYSQHHMAQW